MLHAGVLCAERSATIHDSFELCHLVGNNLSIAQLAITEDIAEHANGIMRISTTVRDVRMSRLT
jgi:hypothetical protein